MTEKMKTATQVAGKVVKTTGKTALWTAKHIRSILGAGALTGAAVLGGHLYKITHKTPEQAHEATIQMTKAVKERVQEHADEVMGTNDTSVIKRGIKEGTAEIAGAGARFGGALREWIVRRNHEKK